jgi:hypothetical protein
MNKFHSFGAKESVTDYRTIIAQDKADGTLPPQHAKVDIEKISTNDLCNQMKQGICTACTVRMMAEQHFDDGVRLSEHWLYLMQETLIEPIDNLLIEGSGIFFGLKCAKNFGVPTRAIEAKYPLPKDVSYAELISYFKKIYGGKVPQEVLDDASKHKIAGYKSIPVNPLSIARHISEGKLIGARFVVGDNTYLPNWKDLFPLRVPKYIDGGHAWCVNEYNGLDENQEGFLINSWSRAWGRNGYGNFIFKTQKPYFTEAWIIEKVPVKVIAEIKKLPVPAYPTAWEKFMAIIKKDNLIEWSPVLKTWIYKK